MPKCDFYSFNIFVNNSPLTEYLVDSEFYVESDLHSTSSYFIEEEDEAGNTQKYPVTPFTVAGEIDNKFHFPLYLKLSVDGKQIWMKPFPPRCRQTFSVQGYKYNHVVRELLFTLPKINETESPMKKKPNNKSSISDLEGTISMECIEARECGTFTTHKTSFQAMQSAQLSDRPGLLQSSKKSSTGNVGVSTREGRTLFSCVPNHGKRKTMIRYEVGKHQFQGVVIKYRPRYMLQDIGIMDEAWSSACQKSMSGDQKENDDTIHNTSTETKDKVNDENANPDTDGTSDFTEKFSKMNCNSPSQLPMNGEGRLFCLSPRSKPKMTVDSPSALKPLVNHDLQKLCTFSPSDKVKSGKMEVSSPSELHINNSIERRIKMEKIEMGGEKKQFRMIEIDDDLQLIEEVDDDVVWMGDDSCCFLDVSDPDISMVDLS
ncbi:uncharacterized protein [Argopecten irradians]|uniref:uncharacterized protein n=1 Tax=Argopecten irradians TaxID=31199 RepID=UPI00371B0B7A